MHRHLATTLSLLTLACNSHPLHGESPSNGNSAIWKVEEKWEARIAEPDDGLAAPQITTTLCPQSSGDGQHAIININVLATPNEIVTWTQSMTHTGNQIVYRITDGHSTTWGDFGGQGFLTSQVDTTTPNLNQYDPAYSLSNSGVVYASNRVDSLILKSIRMHAVDGEVYDIPVNVDVMIQR